MERATFCFRTAPDPEALVAASVDVIVADVLSVDDLAAVDVPGIEVVEAEESLDLDTAVTGVVDAGAGLVLVVDDDVTGLVAEDVVEMADSDADPAAAVTEAAGVFVLEAEGRDEAEGPERDLDVADFFLAGGSSPSKGIFRGRPRPLLIGIISAIYMLINVGNILL